MPIPTPTPVPTPTPTAKEILRRSNEAMGQLEFFRVTTELREDDNPFDSFSQHATEVREVEPEGESPYGFADRATKAKIEREEEYEGQPVWVISYEAGQSPLDSDISHWHMEWVAKDSYLLLRQEMLWWDSFGPDEVFFIDVFSDFNGEPGGAGANIVSTDGLLFDGAISGVRVFNIIAWEGAGSPPQEDCDMEFAKPEPVSLEETMGTPLNINPTYLPAGAFERPLELSDSRGPPAMVCGGQVSRATRLYRGVGRFSIEKWRGPNLYVGNLLAEYVSAGEINGKPAIFVRRAEFVPFRPGEGDAIFPATGGRVIIPEEFGFTVVRVKGRNLPFEEAVKIAEGLE